jgi:protein-arginine kinase activator protein McsA
MKILRHVYLFYETHLPEEGWLQGCYQCYSITSRTINYKNIDNNDKTINFIVYICNKCKKLLKNDTEKNFIFSSKCNNFISEYLESRRPKTPDTSCCFF